MAAVWDMDVERAWDNPEQMIGVDDALERILEHIAPLDVVERLILEALDLVAAREVVSDVAVPPFRNSAMDGYAVCAADTAGAPVRLRLIGTVAAGSTPASALNSGEAIRIMTGAPVPDGSDAVVRFEETDEGAGESGAMPAGSIGVSRAVRSGENVRETGEDVRPGQVVIPAGARLGPAEIGVLASLNRLTVQVHRRPRVAILSTGDELVELGSVLQPGQIRNSNSYTVAALVRQAGAEPIMLGVARDSADDLRSKLKAAADADLIITSGGVSVGDYDIVKEVLRGEGSIALWNVRMKPGKPLAFGTLGGIPLLGLPGNPVAALVSFVQFGRPAIRRMLGHVDIRLPELDAVVTERLTNSGRRRHFVRGVLRQTERGFEASPTVGQGSAILMSVVRANCFIVVPETCEVVEAGTRVRVQMVDGATIL